MPYVHPQINRLSRWEVVDVVRTMSTEAAKAGSSGRGLPLPVCRAALVSDVPLPSTPSMQWARSSLPAAACCI